MGDGDGLGLGEGDGDGEGEGLGEGLGEGDGDGDGLGDGDGEGLGDGDGLGERDIVSLTVTVGVNALVEARTCRPACGSASQPKASSQSMQQANKSTRRGSFFNTRYPFYVVTISLVETLQRPGA